MVRAAPQSPQLQAAVGCGRHREGAQRGTDHGFNPTQVENGILRDHPDRDQWTTSAFLQNLSLTWKNWVFISYSESKSRKIIMYASRGKVILAACYQLPSLDETNPLPNLVFDHWASPWLPPLGRARGTGRSHRPVAAGPSHLDRARRGVVNVREISSNFASNMGKQEPIWPTKGISWAISGKGGWWCCDSHAKEMKLRQHWGYDAVATQKYEHWENVKCMNMWFDKQ